ncbi:MAG: sugar transferase [Roseivirga sp.]|jgi:lipopolysaccharide/colanic/teichoic acid biosynthesis glycosyltransferase|uniref:sugar transferase n=1 Tax=Roseivirga sp. TaxID=1964215 RepID=UPI001B035ECC|nr:sugar transferase [Roseivirga sp.]MBO6496912.1 sugar transferase [Roseivirga sp.]
MHNKYLRSIEKRIIDVIGALFGLSIGLPIFMVASLIILIVDKVNPFFIQQRVGLGGKGFSFLKLRTLKVIEDSDMITTDVVMNKMEYECTITGRFWRRTSIDEMFQFWYVLKGEMSLIGYRPIPIDYVDFLSELDGLGEGQSAYYLDLTSNVKPGLSSLSSVKGRTNLTMREKIELDIEYIHSANLALDLKLLIQSFICTILQKDT